MPQVASHNGIDAPAVDHGHCGEGAWPLLAVVLPAEYVLLRRGRVAIEAPELGQCLWGAIGSVAGDGLETVADPIAAAIDDLLAPSDRADRRRGPRRMDDPLADLEAIARKEAARALVHGYEVGSVQRRRQHVLIRNAVGRVHVDHVAVNGRRAVGRIVAVDAALLYDVEEPDDVCVTDAGRDRLLALGDHVAGLVKVRSIVAVGHACHVEANQLVAVRNHVRPVALHCRRRAKARRRPIVVRASADLGDNELPDKAAVASVEAHEHAAIAAQSGIPGPLVVRADQNPVAGNHGGTVRLASEGRGPAHIESGCRINPIGQSARCHGHVAGLPIAPLRAVVAAIREGAVHCEKR